MAGRVLGGGVPRVSESEVVTAGGGSANIPKVDTVSAARTVLGAQRHSSLFHTKAHKALHQSLNILMLKGLLNDGVTTEDSATECNGLNARVGMQ